MIGRERAELGGEESATRIDEFVGVQPGQEAVAAPRLEHAARFGRREDALLAEDVAEAGEPLLGCRRDDLVADQVEIGVAPVAVLLGHLVRGEQRRHELDRLRGGGGPDGLELLEFGAQAEAVAALCLGGRRAAGEHPAEPTEGEIQQGRSVRRARRAYGREDAAAGGGDLLIRPSGEALDELVLARTGPGQMGVGIDEAGHRGRPPAVEPGAPGELSPESLAIVAAADEGEAPVAAEDLALALAPHLALLGAAAWRRAGRCCDLGEVLDQQVAHGAGRSSRPAASTSPVIQLSTAAQSRSSARPGIGSPAAAPVSASPFIACSRKSPTWPNFSGARSRSSSSGSSRQSR